MDQEWLNKFFFSRYGVKSIFHGEELFCLEGVLPKKIVIRGIQGEKNSVALYIWGSWRVQ